MFPAIHANTVRQSQSVPITHRPTVSQTEANLRTQQQHGIHTDALRNLPGPNEVPRQTFSDSLFGIFRAGVRAFKAIVDRIVAFQQERRLDSFISQTEEQFKDRSLSFTHPQTGVEFSWKGSHFSEMVSSLPKSQRLDAMDGMQTHIQKRIENGARLYDQFSGAGPLPEPTLQNISDFTLYLYATAAAQGDDFTHGAFNVKDPHGRIATWLDASKEVYARSSSHLQAIQLYPVTEQDGSTHLNTPRGIDIPKTYQSGLPVEMQTITYGTISPLPGADGERRLFLKAESFGCRISSLEDKFFEASASGVESRDIRLSDVKDSIGHGLSFVKSVLRKIGLFGGGDAARRESFPKRLKETMDDWRSKGLKGATDKMQSLFSQITNCECEKGGIGLRQLHMTLANVENQLRALPQGERIDRRLVDFISDLKAQIKHLPYNDRLDVRLGEEVIID